MASRVPTFVRIYAEALRSIVARERGAGPDSPRRILLAHAFLLGDTLLLTGLVAKLRERHPRAEIVHVMPAAFVDLFAAAPYGARAVGWSPSDRASAERLFGLGPFDVAYVHGDSRFSWLAAAMGSRHIVAFDGDRPPFKSWPVDERRPMPSAPMTWTDLAATLAPGPAPAPYARGAWKAPACPPFERPRRPYAVLHLGASHRHKTWLPERWAELAKALEARGLEVAWSAGPGEEPLVRAIPGSDRYRSYAGTLTLAQMWHLLAGASLVVCPDTGISHLSRIAFAPTVVLFGPSSPVLGANGSFWRDCPSVGVAVDPFACRDQTHFFKRHVPWVRRCTRGLDECPRARCMDAIGTAAVLAAADRLMGGVASPSGDADATNGPTTLRALPHNAAGQ